MGKHLSLNQSLLLVCNSMKNFSALQFQVSGSLTLQRRWNSVFLISVELEIRVCLFTEDEEGRFVEET